MRTPADFLYESPKSYVNLPHAKTISYQGNGTFVEHHTYNPIRGMILGIVNAAGTHIVAENREYKLKNANRSNAQSHKEMYFLPAARKFQGEYWAKNALSADKPEYFQNETWDRQLEPQPISGGLLVAKSATKNVDYIPGPHGGTSFGRRTNIWARAIVVLWNDGTLEGFYQKWHQGKAPERCIKGAGIYLTEKEMLTHVKNGKLFPFKANVQHILLP